MRIQGTFTLNAQKIAVCIVHTAQTKRFCHSEQYRTAPADKAVLPQQAIQNCAGRQSGSAREKTGNPPIRTDSGVFGCQRAK